MAAHHDAAWQGSPHKIWRQGSVLVAQPVPLIRQSTTMQSCMSECASTLLLLQPQPLLFVTCCQVADAATLRQLHSAEGCTLQFIQPQRFFDDCWRPVAALEKQLGCLVGCNAYITPKGKHPRS